MQVLFVSQPKWWNLAISLVGSGLAFVGIGVARLIGDRPTPADATGTFAGVGSSGVDYREHGRTFLTALVRGRYSIADSDSSGGHASQRLSTDFEHCSVAVNEVVSAGCGWRPADTTCHQRSVLAVAVLENAELPASLNALIRYV